jgi:hypothetical protein
MATLDIITLLSKDLYDIYLSVLPNGSVREPFLPGLLARA